MKNGLLAVLFLAFLSTWAFATTSYYEPAPSPTINNSCSYLYWFDNDTKTCGYKQFCGTYMYYGLQTFKTKEECETALKKTQPLNCTQDVKKCDDGSYVSRDPYNNCEFKPCPTDTTTLKEQVKCVFSGSTATQKCYTADGQFECSGSGTCIANVYGKKGATLVWKSTCGGYAYTTIDGTNKYAEFKCEGGDCKYLYWFDNYTKACGYQKFCGQYMHYGLQTFDSYDACEKALGFGGTEIEQPNIIVSAAPTSTSSSTTTTTATNAYSVGVCPIKEQPVACTMEYAPVCATIQHFGPNGQYSKYRKTFSNACMACASSTKTDLVVEYVSGACSQETDIECPLVEKMPPEACPNGQILPEYGEINGKKCIVGYYCKEVQADPTNEVPVFVYGSYGGFAVMEKTMEVYKNGAIVEKKSISGQVTKMSGQTSSEKVIEFLKNLDAKGFFELKMTNPSCCITKSEGVSMCVADMPIQKMFARLGEKENSIAWCILEKEPEAITYALKMVQEFESLLKENPENTTKYVSLGEIFDLSLGQKAIVRETGLQAKLSSIEPDSALLILKPAYSLQETAEKETSDKWVKIKAGESAEAFGHTIYLNSILFPKCAIEKDLKTGEETTKCYGASPYASLTITKQEVKEKTAYLGEKFELKVSEKATIIDSMSQKKLLWVSLEGISIPVDCPIKEKCDPTKGYCIQGWCDMRAMAKILVSIPQQYGSEMKVIEVTPLAILEGETKTVGEYKIYFAGLSGKNAVFVVNRLSEEIKYIKVSLGEKFKLKEKETALILDKDIFVTLVKSAVISQQPFEETGCPGRSERKMQVQHSVSKTLDCVYLEIMPHCAPNSPHILHIENNKCENEVLVYIDGKGNTHELVHREHLNSLWWKNDGQPYSFEESGIPQEIGAEWTREFYFKSNPNEKVTIKAKNIEFLPEPKPYPATGYAIVSVWKKGWGVTPMPIIQEIKQKMETIQENMKNAGIDSKIMEQNRIASGSSNTVFYKKTYLLNLGESLKIYDIKLSLLDLSEGSAALLAEETPYDDTINVHVGEPFKLKEKMKARVLEANLLMELLGIYSVEACYDVPEGQAGGCTAKNTVKIGVTNYMFAKAQMGKTVSSQQISEKAKSEIIETTGIAKKTNQPLNCTQDVKKCDDGSYVSRDPYNNCEFKPCPTTSQNTPIEIPKPVSVYTLGEGESIAVGEFEITAKAIWADYAEFVVTEKGTGIEFKIAIGKGWNLFSIPGEIKATELNKCNLSNFRLFEYKNGQFVKAQKAEPGKAYGLYNPSEACTIKAKLIKPVSLFELKPLQKGWNFVPVLKDMLGSQPGKMGKCNMKGAFFYDSEGKQWVKAMETTLGEQHFGKALAVYAETGCSLASPDIPIPEIPALPEILEVG
ncbi:MAG: hypothetical protein QXK06_00715 [Candidatus Diapherotrites archaeon]